MILFQKALSLKLKDYLIQMNKNFNGQILLPEENKVKNAIVFLHGYGANSEDLINIGLEWKQDLPTTAFISPNAPFKCEWGENAYQWFDLTSISPEKIGEGLKKAGPHLINLIEDVKKEFSLVESQIAFFGFSQGAMMGLYHLCKRKQSCAGLLAYSGLLFDDKEFENEVSSKFPIRIFHGKDDEVIHYENSLNSYNKLKKMGFSVDHHIQDNLGHGIDKFGLKFGNDFLKKIFKV